MSHFTHITWVKKQCTTSEGLQFSGTPISRAFSLLLALSFGHPQGSLKRPRARAQREKDPHSFELPATLGPEAPEEHAGHVVHQAPAHGGVRRPEADEPLLRHGGRVGGHDRHTRQAQQPGAPASPPNPKAMAGIT